MKGYSTTAIQLKFISEIHALCPEQNGKGVMEAMALVWTRISCYHISFSFPYLATSLPYEERGATPCRIILHTNLALR